MTPLTKVRNFSYTTVSFSAQIYRRLYSQQL